VSNVLSDEEEETSYRLGQQGWPLRRIEKATGVRRETATGYLKAAGIAIRPPGGWGRLPPAKPANKPTTDPEPDSKPANEVTTDSGALSGSKLLIELCNVPGVYSAGMGFAIVSSNHRSECVA